VAPESPPSHVSSEEGSGRGRKGVVCYRCGTWSIKTVSYCLKNIKNFTNNLLVRSPSGLLGPLAESHQADMNVPHQQNTLLLEGTCDILEQLGSNSEFSVLRMRLYKPVLA
jgi:hypothetical protein